MAANVVVSFVTPKGVGSIDMSGIGAVRSRTDITAPAGGATTDTAQDGEVAVIANGYSTIVAVAFGTTPDAAATASTAATSAGFGLPAGQSVTVPVKLGDKISVKILA